MPAYACSAPISLSSQSRGWDEYRSRLPIGPPCTSTGTLRAPWNPALRRTEREPSGSGSVLALCTAMAIRWENAARHGPFPSRSWSSSTNWDC
jgi:hypothetical protein